jgi:soluble lytic murein transglycosylase-like protein
VKRLLLLLFVMLVVPVAGFAAIYTYVDEQGVYHKTNIRYHVRIEDRASERAGVASLGSLNRNAYDQLIQQHSEANGLDPRLVKAVMIAESNGNPMAVSHKGAQGLMQIMPDTAHFLELHHPFDPEENIRAGARYLKILYGIFKGDLGLVLAAYNAGPQKVMQNNMAVPPISETINYVKRVKLYYSRLKNSQ